MVDLAKTLDATLPQKYKEEDGNIYIQTYQDVEPAMDYAKACRREDAERRGSFGKRPDLHRTMSVPFNIILACAQRLGIPQGAVFETEHMRRIVKELKTPEFAAFRTSIDRKI